MKYEITPMTLDNPRYKEFYRQVQGQKVSIANGARIEFHIPMPMDWPIEKRNELIGKPHMDLPWLHQFLRSLLCAVSPYRESLIWKLGQCEKRWAYTGYIMIFNDDDIG